MLNHTPAGQRSRINEICGIDLADGNSLMHFYFSSKLKGNE